MKIWTQEYQCVYFSASGGDQEQAAGSLHLPEDEGRQEDPEGQGHQASPNVLRYLHVRNADPVPFLTDLFTGPNSFRPLICGGKYCRIYPVPQ